MDTSGVKHLKKYVGLIAKKHGGIEGFRDVIRRNFAPHVTPGLETAENDENIEFARMALESLELNREPSSSELNSLEAIIDAEIRPVIDVIDGKFNSTHPLWTQLSNDIGIRDRLEACMESIGRIELPGHPRLPYGGTGFVVGNGLIMTNRHVAEIFAQGVGTRALMFKPGGKAGIDFIRELGRGPGIVFRVNSIVMIHPYWDMAVLAVDGMGLRKTLQLSLTDARDISGHDIAVIGYPAFDPRNPVNEQHNLFNGRYGVKRLQPGELHGGMKTASFQKLVNAATHDCSTLGGNSGSAVIDLSTGDVLALHFGGRYHEQNFAVPAYELSRDKRVVDAGVMFAGTPHIDNTDWAEWWRYADAKENTVSDSNGSAGHSADHLVPRLQSSTATGDLNGTLNIEVPIRISIAIEDSRIIASAVRTGTESSEDLTLEAMREPWRDADYSSRIGYDPDFLNTLDQSGEYGRVTVPMPTAADPQVLAKTNTDDDVLHYQNFSIRMHAKRRLALMTASNVTRNPRLRKPDPDKDYTRKGLSGLNKNDMEKWFLDPRMHEQYQIPDVFFTKDRKAFDKGHIVRRDDVAWGKTYDELRRANGDSYHVTNCSPQVSDFNQSAKGDGNWGDLENHVLSEAANERLCVFAGPVLDPNDQIFHGFGNSGTKLRARIPSRFWKVIVARVEDGLAAYGFVLEQDLTDVQFEYAVPEDFVKTMHPLSDISAMTGVSFDQSLLDADQFESVRGIELAYRSGVTRKLR